MLLDKLEQALRRILSWPFTIPPVEERPELKYIGKAFIHWAYEPSSITTYLYYKIFITNLSLNIIFTGAYWWLFIFRKDIDLGFIHVAYDPEKVVDNYLFGYPTYVFAPLIAFTIIYAFLLFLTKTPYFTRESLLTQTQRETTDYKNPIEPPPKPIAYLMCLVFCSGCLIVIWSIPEYLRELWNWAHDFFAQTAGNLALLSLSYLVFYQLFIAMGIASAAINFVRSSLRERLLKQSKHSTENPFKGGDND